MKRSLYFAAVLVVAGCSGDDEESQPAFNICDNFTTAYDDIVTGLTKTGDNDLMQVRYVGSTPAPPLQGSDNAWTVQLLDMAGSPQPGATVTDVVPFMPEHSHGTSVVPVIGTTDGDGRVEVDSIDFRMVGVWTLTFTVESGTDIDTATFGVCIH
jgi:hypothetical protein